MGYDDNLEREAGITGLRINSDKMEMMLVGNVQMNMGIVIGCQPIEVQQFTYLCSILSSNGDVEADVNCEIGKVSTVFQRSHLILSASTIASRPTYESTTLLSYQPLFTPVKLGKL